MHCIYVHCIWCRLRGTWDTCAPRSQDQLILMGWWCYQRLLEIIRDGWEVEQWLGDDHPLIDTCTITFFRLVWDFPKNSSNNVSAQLPNMSLLLPIREIDCQLSVSPSKNNHSPPGSQNMAQHLILHYCWVGGCCWQSWWEGQAGVPDPELRISEGAPSREYRLWKAAKPDEKFFWPFFFSSVLPFSSSVLPRAAAAGRWGGSFEKAGSICWCWCWQCGRGFGHNVEHNVGYVNPHNASYVWGRRAGQRHWGEPAWKE